MATRTSARAPIRLRALAELELRRRAREREQNQAFDPLNPPSDMTFREWCNALSGLGLQVDGKPFTLANRKALWAIYDLIPTNPVDGYDKVIVIQKGAQMGLTIWEVLASLFLAIKGRSLTLAMYVPDSKLAPYKSEHRFMRLVRSIPDVHRHMVEANAESTGTKGEGNKLTRTLGDSRFLFLWTSGATLTESFPADVVSFDEVQNMTPDDISKSRERLSASPVRFTMLLSTPKWPDADINFWYRQGTEHQFWTACPHCGKASVLADHFPQCLAFDEGLGERRYTCPHCRGWIDDPQDGEWRATYPDRRIQSYQLSQILSPTVTAEQLWWAWSTASTGDQRQNFHNRKLGQPYADPSQIPVNLAMLAECADEGVRLGLVWKATARDTFMGIDQMGEFNVAIIKERRTDGRQAVIHVEAIYSPDPFARCDELMERYGVAVCVVETLPNYNDAKRFSTRHPRKVFLASYADQVDMVAWGDQLTITDRKTSEAERDRYSVRLNQFKAMQTALARIQKRLVLFPDPAALEQDILDQGAMRRSAICRDMVFEHLTRVALVTERNPDNARWSAKVQKVGIDPHFAYANMLCDVAWSRAFGSSLMVFADTKDQRLPGGEVSLSSILPATLANQIQQLPSGVCGRCVSYRDGFCEERSFRVLATDPECWMFMERA